MKTFFFLNNASRSRIACHGSLTIKLQFILIFPALNALPQNKTPDEEGTGKSADYLTPDIPDYYTGEDPLFCCSTIQVSVESNTSYMANYQDVYNIYIKDVNGKPAWLSSSSLFGIWFIPSFGSWVIGQKYLIFEYDNGPSVRSLDVPLPLQISGRSDNIAECPEENSQWVWQNISAWENGKNGFLIVKFKQLIKFR